MTRAMDVAVSVHEAPAEVHLVEVRDSRGSFLCRLFLQPVRGGCHVQVDALEASDEGERGVSLRVAQAATTVLIGVRRPATA
jgi:hypothetical protein